MDDPLRGQAALSFDDLIDDSYLALPSLADDAAPTIRTDLVVFSEAPVLPRVWCVEVQSA